MVVVCVDLTDAGAPVHAEEWLQKVAQAMARSGATRGGQGTRGPKAVRDLLVNIAVG